MIMTRPLQKLVRNFSDSIRKINKNLIEFKKNTEFGSFESLCFFNLFLS